MEVVLVAPTNFAPPSVSYLSDDNLLDTETWRGLTLCLLNRGVSHDRLTWHKQQFLKLQVLLNYGVKQSVYIVDGDTRFSLDCLRNHSAIWRSRKRQRPYDRFVASALGFKGKHSYVCEGAIWPAGISDRLLALVEVSDSRALFEKLIGHIDAEAPDLSFSEYQLIGSILERSSEGREIKKLLQLRVRIGWAPQHIQASPNKLREFELWS